MRAGRAAGGAWARTWAAARGRRRARAAGEFAKLEVKNNNVHPKPTPRPPAGE